MEDKTPDGDAEAAKLAAQEQEVRAAYTDGLRKLADLLDADTDLELPYTGSTSEMVVIPLGAENQRAQLVAWARAMARYGKLRRRPVDHQDGSSSFYLYGTVGGLKVQVITDRETVCRRVVTGTENREVEEIVRPAEIRKVTKPVEIVEWVCEPVTAPSAEAAPEPVSAA